MRMMVSFFAFAAMIGASFGAEAGRSTGMQTSSKGALRGGTKDNDERTAVSRALTPANTRCELRLKQVCVTNGDDSGSELEVHLEYYWPYNDGELGWWNINSGFLDVSKNGCKDVDSWHITVPKTGVLRIGIEEEDDWPNVNDHHEVDHVDACNTDNFEGKKYDTDSGTFEFRFDFW